jgi:hypothetical protein
MNHTETGAAVTAAPHKKRRVLIGLLIFLLIFVAGSVIILQNALLPVTREAGEGIAEARDFQRFSFLPLRCATDLADPACAALGEHPVLFTFLRIPLHTTLTVVDTTPPRFTLADCGTLLGDPVPSEAFVAEASDFSAFSYAVESDGDVTEEGVHTVRVTFTDACGNSAVGETRLPVYGVSDTVTMEAGITAAQCAAALHARVPEAEMDESFPGVDFDSVGTYAIVLTIEGHEFHLRLELSDTTPPTATFRTVYALMGSELSPEDFVQSVRDVSEVSLSFGETPDTSAPGDRRVSVVLRDAAGNQSVMTAPLTVYDIPSAASIEAGCSKEEAREDLLRTETEAFFPDDPDFSSLPLGEHTVRVQTGEGIYEIRVTVEDTTPPTGKALRVVHYREQSTRPTPDDFLLSVSDFGTVTAVFASEPDFDTPGIRSVLIRLTDDSGNKGYVRCTLTVLEEAMPPQITGVRNLTTYVDTRPNYTAGVTATDVEGAVLTVRADASGVDLSTPGRYAVTYTATDSRGLTASVTGSVLVVEVTQAAIRPLAESVLSKVLTDGMTPLEKARAIYDWVRLHISYVAYADKTYWIRAAYYGFTHGRGDCFVFYAVSRILLDCAGIDNLEIRRDDPAHPHFWNLVNCADGWYHFDTCPH